MFTSFPSPAIADFEHPRRSATPAALSLAALCIGLTGCTLGGFSANSTASSTLPQVAGHVHGGQQPVSGATIQLYAANTTLSQGPSAALISSIVHSDANGNFTISGDYTCPAPGALVYIVATGGNPGLPGTVNNPNIALTAVLGTCGTLTTSTFVSINELTTVAAVQSLAPFMLDYAHVGASASNVAGLMTAFQSATAFVDPGTGQFAAPSASGVVPPTALMNTLADIIAACINTSGGSALDGTPCGTLLQYTGTTTDTIASLLSIARSPTANVSSIFDLVSSASPFQPALASAPTSFAGYDRLALSGKSGDGADQLLADSQGHIWLLRPAAGTLSQYDSNLNLLHSYMASSFASGGTGLYMTLDPSDNLWVSLGTALLKIGSDGTMLSPATGYPLVQNGLFTYSPNSQTFTSDSAGNIWIIVNRASDGAVCLAEYSGSGALISPPSGYCGSRTINVMSSSAQPNPTQVIADNSGHVYLFFQDAFEIPIEKFSQSGSYVDFPTTGYYGGVYGYKAAVFDKKDQQIWANGWNYLDKLNLDGSVAFTSYAPGESAGPEQLIFLPANNSIAVDGAGNYWEATLSGGSLVEETSPGVLKGACTGAICGIPVVYPVNDGITGVAINPAGDIFTVEDGAGVGALLKLPGLASAK